MARDQYNSFALWDGANVKNSPLRNCNVKKHFTYVRVTDVCKIYAINLNMVNLFMMCLKYSLKIISLRLFVKRQTPMQILIFSYWNPLPCSENRETKNIFLVGWTSLIELWQTALEFFWNGGSAPKPPRLRRAFILSPTDHLSQTDYRQALLTI